MDLGFSEADLKFRDEVRAFIAERFDDDLKRKMAFTKNGYLDKPGQLKWQKALYERGWAAPETVIVSCSWMAESAADSDSWMP